MNARGIVGTLLAAAMLAACGGDGPSGPGSAGFSARIDGENWSAQGAHALRQQGVVGVAGWRGNTTINMAWVDNGPGTYLINGNSGTAGYLTIGQDGWVATGNSGTSGTITVTTITETRMVGTFEFTATGATGNASGPRQVTQGAFDVAFQTF